MPHSQHRQTHGRGPACCAARHLSARRPTSGRFSRPGGWSLKRDAHRLPRADRETRGRRARRRRQRARAATRLERPGVRAGSRRNGGRRGARRGTRRGARRARRASVDSGQPEQLTPVEGAPGRPDQRQSGGRRRAHPLGVEFVRPFTLLCIIYIYIYIYIYIHTFCGPWSALRRSAPGRSPRGTGTL